MPSGLANAREMLSQKGVLYPLIFVTLIVAWYVGGIFTPKGIPTAIGLLGIIYGGLYALTAMGLVLIYRSSRIINFAQANIGGLASATAVLMVTGEHISFFVALVIGMIAAAMTGWLVEVVFVRRFERSSRLIVTVATIGLAQLLAAGELGLPKLFANLSPLTTFTTPFASTQFTWGPIIFNGNMIVTIIIVPLCMVLLWAFLEHTRYGTAIRATADSSERALLLGIPIRRLSIIVWVSAAVLSGLGSILTEAVQGANIGAATGPTTLLIPLAAAAIGSMESFPIAFFAALVLGVFQQVVFWGHPNSTFIDVGTFVLLLVVLLFKLKKYTRAGTESTQNAAVREARPIPNILAKLPEIRLSKITLGVLIIGAVIFIPIIVSTSKVTLLISIAVYAIVAVSLVILTGWSGQLSLGQFAFVGVGAAAIGGLTVSAHINLLIALVIAGALGAVVAIIVGLPALRIPGLFLAVTTMAFAVPVSTFFLNSNYFPSLVPASIPRPILFNRFSLGSPLTLYYLCLAVLLFGLFVAHNMRKSRVGRIMLAVRDNPKGAAVYGISPLRTRLVAFAVAGAMAGMAGGLYVTNLKGLGFAGISPDASFTVFIMVVIGGLASPLGAVLGAVFYEGIQYFLTGAWQYLATGAGMLIILYIMPEGLGGVFYMIRDFILSVVAKKRGVTEHALYASIPSDASSTSLDPALQLSALEDLEMTQQQSGTSRTTHTPEKDKDLEALLICSDISASYGRSQVLFSVNLSVQRGGVVALLGTNGAGKSTTLKVAAGILDAKKGKIIFDGKDITNWDPISRVLAGLVTMPGGKGVFPSLTVAENLELAGWVNHNNQQFINDTMNQVFTLFPILKDRLSSKAGLLSGGEQQMLTLAQALLCKPKLLLIDELSLGLAPTVVAQLIPVIRQLSLSGVTIVVVEQSVNVATAIASTAVFMERGQVRFSGPTPKLEEQPNLLRSVFLRAASKSQSKVAVNESTRADMELSPDVTGNGSGGAVHGQRGFSVVGISKHFGGISALDSVDISVEPGEILGIIGANGAGKSTLFDVCSGFLYPDQGKIILNDQEITNIPPSKRATMGIGRVFQDALLFPFLTVAETLAVALEQHIAVKDPLANMLRLSAAVNSEEQTQKRVDELLVEMGLTRWRDSFVSELSTGTRRIVELACILAHDPQILLLDEPSAGVAQRESEALGKLILAMRDKTKASFVVIEHDVPLVSAIADKMICMHLGAVLSKGLPFEVLNDPAVIAAYLGTDDTAILRTGPQS
ncbi:MAG: ATP-binding cassette domain-containing protein [Actinobacteria bacterium]|nr:ATP-binding cassette domain-containing protein [Actinomycetota bacterium]MCL6104925.1 ATP-binding cassette domain-containing protein [Actinomycetota bacterium]